MIDVIRIEMNVLELNTGIFSTKNCMNDAGITVRIPKKHGTTYLRIRLSFCKNATKAKTVITGRKQSATSDVMLM
jgi:hypothetical protein